MIEIMNFYMWGALSGCIVITLGAFGAHGLKDQLSEYSMSVYEKAVLYQMFHALGILLVTLLGQTIENLDVSLSIWFFVIGIVLFSGSLYLLAITGIKSFGIITPIGGFFFVIGWFLLILKVF